jgi:hypothetical protein
MQLRRYSDGSHHVEVTDSIQLRLIIYSCMERDTSMAVLNLGTAGMGQEKAVDQRQNVSAVVTLLLTKENVQRSLAFSTVG